MSANSHAVSNGKPKSQQPTLAVLYDMVAPMVHHGNVTIYFAPLDTTGVDQIDQPEWWKHCPYTKTVSLKGAQDAKEINRALIILSPRIGLINTSELCYALTTATYIVANQSYKIYSTADLNPVYLQRQSGMSDNVIKTLVHSKIITTIVDTVTILSGHTLTPTTSPHPVLADLQPGESAIFKTLPDGNIELIARLNVKQWAEMADYIAKKALSAQSKKLQHKQNKLAALK